MGTRLPDELVTRMYADYLRTRSLRETAKIHGRKGTNLRHTFRLRGLRIFEKIHRDVIIHAGVKYTPGKGGYMRRTSGYPRTPLHVAIWMEANGAVPAGHVVMFKDGNMRNFDLGNLECLPKARMHSIKGAGKNNGENGWTKARSERRIQEHMGFIVRTAQYFQARARGLADLDELIQAGRRAVAFRCQGYDAKKAKFLTYAGHAIRSEMMKVIAEETGAVRVPINKWHQGIQINAGIQRLDAPIEGDGEMTFGDCLVDDSAVAHTDACAGRDDLAMAVERAIGELKPVEQRIAREVLLDGKTQRDVSVEFGVSRSAIYLRLLQIKRKLRHKLRNFQEAI